MNIMAAGKRRARSGALGAALLALAALLAPGEARAVTECGTLMALTLNCGNTAYDDGILYMNPNALTGTRTFNIAGSSTATTTITAGASQAVGVRLDTDPDSNNDVTLNMGGETGGTAHVVNIRQGTNTNNAADRNNGIYLSFLYQSGHATINLRDGVTIGQAATPMKQNGIYARVEGSLGWGAHRATITSAAPIFAAKKGIRLERTTSTTADPTTITNSGAIGAGEEGIYLDYAAVTRPSSLATVSAFIGPATITNSGTITVSGAYAGIHMNYRGAGDAEITNEGAITAPLGSGIRLDYNPGSVGGNAGAVTVTNSADISAAAFGIRVERDGTGDATVKVTGGQVTASGRNADLSAHAAALRQLGTADAIFELAAGAGLTSMHNAGMFVTLGANNISGQIRITQGGAILGRTGVLAEVPREIALGEPARGGEDQPLIDIAWSGSFTVGSATSDTGRFAAADAADVLTFDQEAAAGVALEDAVRYGGPAGIEAYAMSWRDVVAQVAKGDDPDEIADGTAQTALLATSGAASRRTAILAQFKAALGNEYLMVAAPVLTAIGTTATTSAADLTDTQIVGWLSENDDGRRTLLRNVLAQGLSDGEKAVLRAVATGDNDDVEAALRAAGFAEATETPESYWNKVLALLGRSNPGNIRIAMTAGSIASRGDGIRAYFATGNTANGAISITVAAGTTVTAAAAGIYVANAGLDEGEDGEADDILKQSVTVNGKVTGGTDAAVHLVGGGTLTVGEGGELIAGTGRPAILVNDPGRSVIRIDGKVVGATGAAGAVDLSGGGSVTVGLGGRIAANGARRTVHGSDDLAITVTLVTDGMIVYREDAEEQHARMEGVYRPQNVAEVLFREEQDGAATGYSRTLPVHRVTGELDTSGLPSRPLPQQPGTDPTGPGTEPGTDPTGPTGPGTSPGTGPGTDPTTPGTDPMTPGPGPGTDPTMGPAGPAAPVRFACQDAEDRRCRLYEALPSLLLAMSALPSYPERMSAPRDVHGGWARVEASRGAWQAKRAATGPKLAYDHRWSVGQAGVDIVAGENARLGLSVHALGGKAEMAGIGEIELTGMGAGISATWLAGDVYLDAQAQTTAYDASLKSAIHGDLLRDDASGLGYGLAVEAGSRLPVAGIFMTPHAGVAWSRFDLEDFTDLETAGGPRVRVAVADVDSLKGRLGVTLETELGSSAAPGPAALVFGTLAVEREFSDETQVKVGTETLTTELRPTALRLGAGGVLNLDQNIQMRATLGYRTSGIGTDSYRGGLELQVQF